MEPGFCCRTGCLGFPERSITGLPKYPPPKDFLMTRFLAWLRSIMGAVLNGVAKFVFLIILIFVVLLVIGLRRGGGLPGHLDLTMDHRQPVPDSATTGFSLSGPQQTVMNYVFALDAA